jgi:hypothetical protein
MCDLAAYLRPVNTIQREQLFLRRSDRDTLLNSGITVDKQSIFCTAGSHHVNIDVKFDSFRRCLFLVAQTRKEQGSTL